jgi:predicted nucleotidyltransferase
MNDYGELVREMSHHLREEGVGFALIGGLAVSVRTEPRTTKDVDFVVVAASEAALDRLIRDLRSSGWIDLANGAVFQRRATGSLALIRMVPRRDAHGPCVDLLFGTSGIEPEIVAEAQTLKVGPRLSVPVARTGHLLALKVLANRLQDLADLARLLEVADSEELALAFESLALIEERGFHEGRDLRAELQAFIDRPKRPDPWVLRS